jgi:hypothetical protein
MKLSRIAIFSSAIFAAVLLGSSAATAPAVNGLTPYSNPVTVTTGAYGDPAVPVSNANPFPVSVVSGGGGATGGATSANQVATGAAAQTFQGAEAQGVVATANPVMGGCLANGGTPTATTANFNRRIWCGLSGNQASFLTTLTGSALYSGAISLSNLNPSGVAVQYTGSLNYNYDGTLYQPQRGDVSGTFMQGPDVIGVVPTGKPLPLGCMGSGTPLTGASGVQRVWCGTSGQVFVSLSNGGSAAQIAAPTGDGAAGAASLVTYGQNFVFNGTTWDRQRGDVNGTWIGGQFNTSPTTLTSGQSGSLQLDANQNVKARIIAQTGTTIDALPNAAGWLLPPSGNANLPIAAVNYNFNGTTWDRTRGDTNGTYMQGNVPLSGTITANPILTGCLSSASAPAGAANGLMGRSWCSNNGAQATFLANVSGVTANVGPASATLAAGNGGLYVNNFNYNYDSVASGFIRAPGDANGAVTQVALSGLQWNFASTAGGTVVNTTVPSVIVGALPGSRNYITAIQVTTDALTTASEFTVTDGAGSVLWRYKLQAGVNTFDMTFPVPLKATAVNQALRVGTGVATGAALGIYVNAQGFQSTL